MKVKWKHMPAEDDLTECWLYEFGRDSVLKLDIFVGRMETNQSRFNFSLVGADGKTIMEMSNFETLRQAKIVALGKAADLFNAAAVRLRTLVQEVLHE